MDGSAEWWIGAGVFLTGVIIAFGAAVAQMRRPKADSPDRHHNELIEALGEHRETLLSHRGAIERHGDALERHRQAVATSTDAIERHHTPRRK